MNENLHTIPVMTCAEAKSFEKTFFENASQSEESAMAAAGTAVGDGILNVCVAMPISRVLVMVGKGHNGGDAIIAATRMFNRTSCRIAIVLCADSVERLAPLTRKFLGEFAAVVPEEKRVVAFVSEEDPVIPAEILSFAATAHVFIDGIFGHSFRPPFAPKIRLVVQEILAGRSRESVVCSVDLPSGLCDSGAESCVVRADYTFATGILKRPLLAHSECAGHIVPLEIGFPTSGLSSLALVDEAGLRERIFSPRPLVCDKRDFGHVLIIGGSRTMPGALLMNTIAALRAGAGLVSVICPERVQAAFAARAPGAMWMPCSENSEGGLDSVAAFEVFQKLLPKATAVLCGSGMGTSSDTQSLIQDIILNVPKEIPLVIDADALRPAILPALNNRDASAEYTILLPHAGEFARLGGNAECPQTFCQKHPVTLALKGVFTRITDNATELFTFSGTPALARGGSGDVLAGMVAAIFAAPLNYVPGASARERLTAAVVWHGAAAKKLAAVQGERCAEISSLPDFLNN